MKTEFTYSWWLSVLALVNSAQIYIEGAKYGVNPLLKVDRLSAGSLRGSLPGNSGGTVYDEGAQVTWDDKDGQHYCFDLYAIVSARIKGAA